MRNINEIRISFRIHILIMDAQNERPFCNSERGDLLTTWNGKTLSSDTIGNMTSDGTWSYSWEHGRELASMSSGGTTWSFTYDADGMRTARSNGSRTYSYVYNGSSLSQMTVDGHTLRFSYDASGTPVSVTYDGTEYYYVVNLQGDIVAILNGSGNTVVAYTYDAWGKLLTTTGSLASTLGTHNPLRYRGYVYDQETGLYYLQTRYYNPTLGRFLNADAFAATGQGMLGNNMFAYCGNNPVSRADDLGTTYTSVYPTCWGGVGAKPISGQSDGQEMSDELLEYIIAGFIPFTEGTVYVDVEYLGIYTHSTDRTISTIFTLLGGLGLLALVPGIKEASTVSMVLGWLGAASSVSGILGLMAPQSIPDKDYHQYNVTISWAETESFNGNSNYLVHSTYSIEMSFLWNDTSYTSPSWYLQNTDMSESRYGFMVR